MTDSIRLESCRGLAALVTGASSGIGRLLALRLAKDGARVALVARREAELESLADEIRAQSGEALVLPCDVGDSGQVAAAAERGWVEWRGVVLELLTSIARAGADVIITYHAPEAAAWIEE